MARPGGNPSLVNHQFSTDRDEKLSQKITIRITDLMLKQLQEKGDYREYCRQAIAEKFSTDEDEKLSQKITIEITDAMLKQLQEKDNYREYCKQAIAEALFEDERLAEKLERDSQSSS